jgi:hypothetical protein
LLSGVSSPLTCDFESEVATGTAVARTRLIATPRTACRA